MVRTKEGTRLLDTSNNTDDNFNGTRNSRVSLGSPNASRLNVSSPVPPDVRDDPPTNVAREQFVASRSMSRMKTKDLDGSPKAKPAGVFDFRDSEAMKERVREALLKTEPYSVTMYYYETGLWQKIARHAWFDNITLMVIALNAIWMMIETDYNPAETLLQADMLFQIAEQFFTIYFCFEWTVRFMAFERKRDGLKDGWFVFDSCLVLMMFLETWVLNLIAVARDNFSESPLGGASVLRLFRLLRLSRLMRMLRGIPELMVLIKGITTAMKSVLYVTGLLFIITYVFAIAFKQLCESNPPLNEEFFSSIPLSMYSLLIHGTFLDDLAFFCDMMLEERPELFLILVPFVCLACLTVMNMLVGVLCEVVCAVAETEKETILTIQVSNKMSAVLKSLDLDGNMMISFVEFKKLIQYPDALQALGEVGVDPIAMIDFAEMFFLEDGEPKEISFEEFMEMVLDLRGANKATVKDIMNLWRQINQKMVSINADVTSLKAKIKTIEIEVRETISELEAQVDEAMGEVQRLLVKHAKIR
eukprot:TRINITY_DN39942_c0_g1_i1.p1 TRINITY_DN39942_c0_g1~~TRINITY_DN39942_c0_g1_i1.p1  ORF type:complete len:576 (+),score=110.79 TRINITY_DN39942_c0_g1_i1:138-1730(+)